MTDDHTCNACAKKRQQFWIQGNNSGFPRTKRLWIGYPMHRSHAAGVLIMRIDAAGPATDSKLVACTRGSTSRNMDHGFRSRAEERLVTIWLDVQRRVDKTRGGEGHGEAAHGQLWPAVSSTHFLGSDMPRVHGL